MIEAIHVEIVGGPWDGAMIPVPVSPCGDPPRCLDILDRPDWPFRPVGVQRYWLRRNPGRLGVVWQYVHPGITAPL